MFYLVLLITGYAIGFLSSFFGIGGGSLIIPVLYTLLPESPHTFIIATSLGAIFLNTTLNSYRYYKDGLFPNSKTITYIIGATCIGSLIAYIIVGAINKEQAKVIFSLVLMIMILKILLSKEKVQTNQENKTYYSDQKIMITCLLGSIVSGITGLGGGIVFVPLLMSYVHINSKEISVYSNLAMMATALTGLIPYFFKDGNNPFGIIQVGQVNILIITLLFFGSIFSSKLGVKVNNRTDDRIKKKILIVVLLILAVKNII